MHELLVLRMEEEEDPRMGGEGVEEERRIRRVEGE